MNAHRIPEIVSEALERSDAERARFVAEACAGDEALRREAESLIEAALSAGTFMGSPTADVTGDRGTHNDAAGTQVGPYRLLERIGEGGFGTVYLADQTKPVRRRVAVKVIKLGMDTRQVIARFEAERQALAMMDHPHIARVLDAGATHIGRPYFVMELVKGVPITQYCDDHRVGLQDRLALFTDVCHAVQHAHTKGIIHRDLKPSNVLVSRHDDQPVVKVIDFGIAKATGVRLTDKTLHTEWRQLIGTPTYMSPEQAGMSDLDVDTRSDIYALGVLLYELLTGTTPFDKQALLSSGFDEMRRVIREEEPPKPSTRLSSMVTGGIQGLRDSGIKRQAVDGGSSAAGSLNRSVPHSLNPSIPHSLVRALRGDLDWIVMKCLEKDRSRRYETASGLAMDVQRHRSGEPVVAAPPSGVYRFRKFVRRNRATVTAAVVVVISLVVGIAGTTFGLLRTEERRVQAETAQGREREQRELAEKREQQKAQVADFLDKMLSDINVEALDSGIKVRFREQVRAALAQQYVGEYPNRRKRSPEEIDAELAVFDQRGDAAQTADVARQVLDEFLLAPAADALEKQFADQPQVRAQLHQALGAAYKKLGLSSVAESHFRTALEIARREPAEVERLTKQLPQCYRGEIDYSLLELGMLRLDQGDPTSAEPLLREALALARKMYGDESSQVARILSVLANVLFRKGEHVEEAQLLREVLSIRRKLPDVDDVSDGLTTLACFYGVQGDYAVAEPLLREALAIERKAHGDEDLQVASSLADLAWLLHAKGDDSAAEPLLREALAIRRKLLGDAHPLVALDLQHLGLVLRGKSEDGAAEPLFREALAMQRKLLGDEHWDVVGSLHNLGLVLQEKGDLAAAEPLFREALAIGRRLPGDAEHPDVAPALAALGGLLLEREEHTEAEPIVRECMAIREKALKPDSKEYWLLANTRSMLGGALVGQGAALIESDPPAAIAKFIEAEPLLVEAGQWLTQNSDHLPPQYRAERFPEALERIVRLYESWDTVAPDSGKAEQAAKWRAELQNLPGP